MPQTDMLLNQILSLYIFHLKQDCRLDHKPQIQKDHRYK